MAVFRVHKTKNYTMMSNRHLRDKDLSLKAKGMLSMMFTLPDDWRYNVSGLTSLIKEGKTTVRTVLKELKEAGYVVVTKTKNPDTGLFEYVYDVFETPIPPDQRTSANAQINPDTGFPYLVTPQLVIPGLDDPGVETLTLLNTEILKTESPKTEERKKEGERGQGAKGPAQKRGHGSRSSFDAIIAERTDNSDLAHAIGEFIRMRSRIKKPLTDYALQLRLNKLWRLGKTDEERIAIVEQSIGACWQDFFPLREADAVSNGGSRDASDDEWDSGHGW